MELRSALTRSDVLPTARGLQPPSQGCGLQCAACAGGDATKARPPHAEALCSQAVPVRKSGVGQGDEIEAARTEWRAALS
eukprot:2937749-Alexandrium_andersonii.AAC.1